MKPASFAAAALLLCVSAAVRPAAAQAPCTTKTAVVDSARDDVLSVLTSDRPLVLELRQEQGLTKTESLKVVPVNERFVCAKMAAAFNRMIPPGVTFAVLRIGSIYYARDPDQRRATGVITDSTFRVIMRLGASVSDR